MQWLLLSFIVALTVAVFVGIWHSSFSRFAPQLRSDVLLVFAHPDDEAMFFSPLLMYLRRINVKVHFLCLSNGNFAGLGAVREKELVASAAYYGVHAGDVTTINDERLPDGMQSVWDPTHVAQIIRHTIASKGGIRTVVTFDNKGVSSHPNHIAVHEGVRLLATQQGKDQQRSLLFLQLRTRSLLAKYVGPLSLVPYFFKKRADFHGERNRADWVVLARPKQVLGSLQGLQRHKSQLLWFRYLFVFFSSYGYVNEFSSIE